MLFWLIRSRVCILSCTYWLFFWVNVDWKTDFFLQNLIMAYSVYVRPTVYFLRSYRENVVILANSRVSWSKRLHLRFKITNI